MSYLNKTEFEGEFQHLLVNYYYRCKGDMGINRRGKGRRTEPR